MYALFDRVDLYISFNYIRSHKIYFVLMYVFNMGITIADYVIFFVALLMMCRLSSKVKFYIKYLFYGLYVFLLSVGVLFLSLLTPRNVDNISIDKFTSGTCEYWRFKNTDQMTCENEVSLIKYFLYPFQLLRWLLGIKIEMRDKHYIPGNQPCILVSNHQNSFDLLGMAAMNLRRGTFLARKENLIYYGPFGWATWLCGAIFIDRYNHKSAMKTIEECSNTLKTKHIKLWIYPEGTIVPHVNTFLPFKKGAFNIAVNAQIPVVPVVFSSYNHFHSAAEKRFDEGKIILTALPPVSTEGMTADDVVDLTARVRNDMLEVYKRTSAELAS